MKNVLVISYYWPPSGGPGVQRTLKFAKYMTHFAWTPIVLIPQKPNYPNYDESHLSEIKNIITVRHNFFEPHSVYKKLIRMKEGEKITSTILTDTSNSVIEKLLKWIRFNLFLPDARIGSFFSNQNQIKSIFINYKIDLIFSSGPPHSTHLLANKWGKKMRIPTILDLRDPWVDFVSYQGRKRFFLSAWIDKFLEKRTLEAAKKVVVISPSMKKFYLDYLTEESIHVITNGFDSEDFKKQNETIAKEFLWTYTGNLDKNRVPYAFLKAMSKIRHDGIDIRCQFVGRQCPELSEQIKSLNLDSSCTLEGFIPHYDSVKKIQASFGLILVIDDVPNNESFLTGKIFEYIAAQKPIIGIGPINGDAAKVLNDSKSGKMFAYKDVDNIYNCLLGDYKNFLAKKIRINQAELYERKYLTKKLCLLFDEVIH